MPETVSDEPDLHVRPEMGVVGYLVALGSAIVLLPLAPLLVALRLVDWFRSDEPRDRRRGGTERAASGPSRDAT